jgi:hypothetical protein
MGGKNRPYVPVGKSAAEMKAEQQAANDAQPIITRCAFCKWEYAGTALEGRELAKGHRRVHHPDIQVTRRRRGSLTRHMISDDSFRAEGQANARKVAASLARLEEAS